MDEARAAGTLCSASGCCFVNLLRDSHYCPVTGIANLRCRRLWRGCVQILHEHGVCSKACADATYLPVLDHRAQGAGGSQRQRLGAVLNGFHLTDVPGRSCGLAAGHL